MAAPETYTLTVDLTQISGVGPSSVNVKVEMSNEQLVYPIGSGPSQTLYPTTIAKSTNADGIAAFELFPSTIVGNYIVRIGKEYERTITMPASDTYLSALGDAVEITSLDASLMLSDMSNLASDLTADELAEIWRKLNITSSGGAELSDQLPQNPGVASAGTGTRAARDDHRHASPPLASSSQDGLMSSGVFSRVAGMEDGATADQTKQDILTLLGPGSASNDGYLTQAQAAKIAGLEIIRLSTASTDAQIASARTSNYNVLVITADITISTADVYDGAGAGLSTLQSGDLLIWDQGESRWERAVNLPAEVAASVTNLSVTQAAASVTINSSTGTGATIPEATTTQAGVYPAADKTKMNSIEANAKDDQTAAEIIGLIEAQTGTSKLDADALKNLHAHTPYDWMTSTSAALASGNTHQNIPYTDLRPQPGDDTLRNGGFVLHIASSRLYHITSIDTNNNDVDLSYLATLGGGAGLSDSNPQAPSTASPGVALVASRADHRHPVPTQSDVYAKAKDIFQQGSNVTLTKDDTNSRITVASSGGGGGTPTNLSDDTPQGPGTASAGTGNEASRDDHVHPLPTNAQIKTGYEANADTNAYTDSEKSKLGEVPAIPDAATEDKSYSLKVSSGDVKTWEENTVTGGNTDTATGASTWQEGGEQSNGISPRDWQFNFGNGADGRGGGTVILNDNKITKIGWNTWLDGTNRQFSVEIGVFFNPQVNFSPTNSATYPAARAVIPHPTTTNDNHHAMVELDTPVEVPQGTRIQVDVINLWDGANPDRSSPSNTSVGSWKANISVGFEDAVTTAAGGGASLSDDTPQPPGTASAGSGDAAARDDHVHPLPTQANIYDSVKEILQAGSNVTLTENDTSSELTVASSGGGGTTLNLSDSNPQGPGTASAGSGHEASRDDHIHPLPSAAEIKTLYEGNANTNAFTDALLTKLTNVEANATADQTQADIYTLLKAILRQGSNVTLTNDDANSQLTVASSGGGGTGEVLKIGFVTSDATLASARTGTSPFNLVQVTQAFNVVNATVHDTQGNALPNLSVNDLLAYDAGDSKWERIYTQPAGGGNARTDNEILDLCGGLLNSISGFAYNANTNTLTYVPQGRITLEQVTDRAGQLLATLSEFTYDASNNTLTFTDDSGLTQAQVQDIAGAICATSSYMTYDSTNNTVAFTLLDNSVTEDKILDGAVASDKLADAAVITIKLADDAVTPAKLDADTEDKRQAMRTRLDVPSQQDVEFQFTDYSDEHRPVTGTNWFEYHFASIREELRVRSAATGRKILLSAHFEIGPTNGVTVDGELRVRYSNDANASSNTGTWVEVGDTVSFAFTSATRQKIYIPPRIIPNTAQWVNVSIRRTSGTASAILYDSSIHVTLHKGEVGYYPQSPSTDEQTQARTNLDVPKKDLSDLPSDLDAAEQLAIRTKIGAGTGGGGGLTAAQATDIAGNLVGNVNGFSYDAANDALTYVQPHDSIGPDALIADSDAQKLAIRTRIGAAAPGEASDVTADGNLTYHRLGRVNLFTHSTERTLLDTGINISNVAPESILVNFGRENENPSSSQGAKAGAFHKVKYQDLVDSRSAQSFDAGNTHHAQAQGVLVFNNEGADGVTLYLALAGNGNLLVSSSVGSVNLYQFEVGYEKSRRGEPGESITGPPGPKATIEPTGIIAAAGVRRQAYREESYGGIDTGTSLDGNQINGITKGHDGRWYIIDDARIEAISDPDGSTVTSEGFRTINDYEGLVYHPGLNRYYSIYQNTLVHLGVTGIDAPETVGTIGGSTASAFLGLCIDDEAENQNSLYCLLRAGTVIQAYQINPTTGQGSTQGSVLSGFSGTARFMVFCRGIPFLVTYDTANTTLRLYHVDFAASSVTLQVTINNPDGDPKAGYYDADTDRLLLVTGAEGFVLLDRYTNTPARTLPHDVASVRGLHQMYVPIDLDAEPTGLSDIPGAIWHRNLLNPSERYISLPAGRFRLTAAALMINCGTAAGNKGERCKVIARLEVGGKIYYGAGDYARGSQEVGSFRNLDPAAAQITMPVTLTQATDIKASLWLIWDDDPVSNTNEIKAVYQMAARFSVEQLLAGADTEGGGASGIARGTYVVIQSGTLEDISVDVQTRASIQNLPWPTNATYQDVTFEFAQSGGQSGRLALEYRLNDAGSYSYHSVLKSDGSQAIMQAGDRFTVRFTREHLVGSQLELFYMPSGSDNDGTVRVRGTLTISYEDLGATSDIVSAQWHHQLADSYFLGQVTADTTVANATVTTLDFERPFAAEELMEVAVGYRINDVDDREWNKSANFFHTGGYADLTDSIRSDDHKEKRFLFGEWPSEKYAREVSKNRDNEWIQSTSDDSPLVAMMLQRDGAEVVRASFMCWTASCEILYIDTMLRD